MQKFKKGDNIIVMQGKDKGRKGTIERIFPKEGKALIPGINLYKKHVKKTQASDGEGGVYDVPRAIGISKLSHVDPKTGKPTRVGFILKNGKKVRVAKKSGKEIGENTSTNTKKKPAKK